MPENVIKVFVDVDLQDRGDYWAAVCGNGMAAYGDTKQDAVKRTEILMSGLLDSFDTPTELITYLVAQDFGIELSLRPETPQFGQTTIPFQRELALASAS